MRPLYGAQKIAVWQFFCGLESDQEGVGKPMVSRGVSMCGTHTQDRSATARGGVADFFSRKRSVTNTSLRALETDGF